MQAEKCQLSCKTHSKMKSFPTEFQNFHTKYFVVATSKKLTVYIGFHELNRLIKKQQNSNQL